MRIVVFGATGGTGQEIVQRALSVGHHVRAAVRTPSKMDYRDPNLEVFKADIYDPISVAAAIEGQEAVLTAVAPKGFSLTEKTDLFSQSAKAILPAMQKHDVKRLIAVSTSARRGYSPDNHPVFELIIKNIFWRTLYSDVVAMDDLIMKSPVYWTLIRPPQVIDKPATGTYRIAEQKFAVPGGASIGRADLAAFIVSVIDAEQLYCKNVAIAY
ncbi:MAG: NAD(P)H-binding protein [Chloroflexota bacterium]|nr:NAD(P)H-binding protein [Chloroflexota bacterium]